MCFLELGIIMYDSSCHHTHEHLGVQPNRHQSDLVVCMNLQCKYLSEQLQPLLP